jgi:hypothetical protein
MTYGRPAGAPTLDPALSIGNAMAIYPNGYSIAGASSAPAVSTGTRARLYYDSTTQKLRASFSGSGYADLLRAGDPGVVSSVGLTMPTTFTVTGTPITTSGTFSVAYATQTANTLFAGPTTGAAAAPTFRSMVLADIPDGLITFAKWAAQCAANEIPKRNAANTAWVCATDNTSPGGTAWVTSGNTSVTGGLMGTLDANAFQIQTNANTKAAVTLTGFEFWQPTSIVPSANAFASAVTTFRPSVRHNLTSRYWNGTTSVDNNFSLEALQNSATAGDAQIQFRFNGNAIGYMDSGGNMGGWASIATSQLLGATTWITTSRGTPGLSAAGTGRMYFDSTLNKYVASENGSAYTPVVGQGSTVWCEWAPTDAQLPGSGYAYVQFRQDREYLTFEDASTMVAYFTCTMPSHYDGSTLAVVPHWTSSTTTGNVMWGIAIENQTAVSQNVAFAATEVTGTQGIGTAFNLNTSIVANITNAGAGTPAAYSRIRIRVRRLGADASDTMTTNAELYGLMIRK